MRGRILPSPVPSARASFARVGPCFELRIVVSGIPVPQPRQSFSPLLRRDGSAATGPGGRPILRQYIPDRKRADGTKQRHEIHGYKQAIINAFRAEESRSIELARLCPVETPVVFVPRFFFGPPADGKAWIVPPELFGVAIEPYTGGGGDFDNLAKAPVDALTRPRLTEREKAERFGLEESFFLSDDRLVFAAPILKAVDRVHPPRAELLFRWSLASRAKR